MGLETPHTSNLIRNILVQIEHSKRPHVGPTQAHGYDIELDL